MTDDALIAAFFEEAEELLAAFEAGLLQLEARADDVELLNGIFRSAHTLKGNSAMLGFDEIARVTHGLEDLLDHLRKGRLEVSARVIDALLYAKDVVRRLVARVRDGGEATPEENAAAEDLMAALRALIAGEEPLVEQPARPAGLAVAETASIRVPVEKVDRLIDLVGELVITQSMVADAVATFAPKRLASLRAPV